MPPDPARRPIPTTPVTPSDGVCTDRRRDRAVRTVASVDHAGPPPGLVSSRRFTTARCGGVNSDAMAGLGVTGATWRAARHWLVGHRGASEQAQSGRSCWCPRPGRVRRRWGAAGDAFALVVCPHDLFRIPLPLRPGPRTGRARVLSGWLAWASVSAAVGVWAEAAGAAASTAGLSVVSSRSAVGIGPAGAVSAAPALAGAGRWASSSTASSNATGGRPATSTERESSDGAAATLAASDTAIPNPNAAHSAHRLRRPELWVRAP